MLHIKKLKLLIEDKKVSQEYLANIIGLTRNGFQKKMKSPKSFFVEELYKISDHFNMPVTYFFSEDVTSTQSIEKQIDKVFDTMKEVVKEKMLK